MPNKNRETEIWKIRNREAFYFLCQAKGRHSRLAPQELCPPVLGNYRGSYRWNWQSRVSDKDESGEGPVFFFLQYFKTVTVGIRQPGNWVHLSLGYQRGDLLYEM